GPVERPASAARSRRAAAARRALCWPAEDCPSMLAGCDGWRMEHYYKPAQHELGWAGFQMRAERAIVRYWHRVRLAVTFSLLAGRPPAPTTLSVPAAKRPGERSGPRLVWQATLRAVRRWLSAWARVHGYWQSGSTAPPPPELAALLEHVGHSRPLAAPT